MKSLGLLRAAWALVLSGALVWGSVAGHATWPALTGRMLSSVLLVVAAGLAWRLTGTRLMAWILAGMTFGTVGDFINAGLLAGGTLAGMVAFGIGHVCYVMGILGALAERRAPMSISSAAVVIWMLAGVLGWYAVVFLASAHGLDMLVWPALGYTLLLSATAGFATALAIADPAYRLLALGAALFLLSDMVLGMELFRMRGRFTQSTLAVWITYGVGQMLIVFTAAREAVRPVGSRSPT